MRKNLLRTALITSPLAATLLLGSCVVPGHSYDSGYSSPRSRVGVYTTLPTTYVGSAYYHDGRYYSGGSYQTGSYNHAGRTYTSRYYHNGQYIYGGQHRDYGGQTRGSGTYAPSRLPESRGTNYRPGGRDALSRGVRVR